jgi:hypothetical protein
MRALEICCVAEQIRNHHTSGYSLTTTILLLFNIMEHVQPRELHTDVGSQGVNALIGQMSNDTDRFTAATAIPPVNNTIGLHFLSRGNLFV